MKKTMKMAWAVVVAVGLAGSAPGASAQEQIGCFRGKPLPDCKTFWIVEMQGVLPMTQTSRTITFDGNYGLAVEARAFDNALEWNIGHMVNVGDKYALGGVFTVGTGGADPLTAVRLRGRKWLSKDLSVELEGGVLWSAETDRSGFDGWTTDVRLNIRDQGSFFLRYDGVSIPGQSFDYGYSDPGGIHQGLSLGASAGSVPALIGSGAIGAFYLVLFALFWEAD